VQVRGVAQPLSLQELPKDAVAVEKIRYDLPNGGSVHHLEDKHGTQVGMVSSGYFISGFWNTGSFPAKEKVANMLLALYDLGIYAFSCYGQHHAIVFYADLQAPHSQQLLTPAKLAMLLSGPRGDALVAVLQDHSLNPGALAEWRSNYASNYIDQL
jgi:hypothetical protein